MLFLPSVCIYFCIDIFSGSTYQKANNRNLIDFEVISGHVLCTFENPNVYFCR